MIAIAARPLKNVASVELALLAAMRSASGRPIARWPARRSTRKLDRAYDATEQADLSKSARWKQRQGLEIGKSRSGEQLAALRIVCCGQLRLAIALKHCRCERVHESLQAPAVETRANASNLAAECPLRRAAPRRPSAAIGSTRVRERERDATRLDATRATAHYVQCTLCTIVHEARAGGRPRG